MHTVIPASDVSRRAGIESHTFNLALSLSKGGQRNEPCFDKLSTGLVCTSWVPDIRSRDFRDDNA